jgi:RNA polymerase sigma factor (sigma-70 family)
MTHETPGAGRDAASVKEVSLLDNEQRIASNNAEIHRTTREFAAGIMPTGTTNWPYIGRGRGLFVVGVELLLKGLKMQRLHAPSQFVSITSTIPTLKVHKTMRYEDSRTGATLTDLIRFPNDPAAWEAFVERYGRKILSWCRRWGLQEADAENVTQEVLLKLAKNLHTYDPSKGRFRAWLKTLAHNAWQDYLESYRRPGAGSGDTRVMEKIQSIAARDDLATALGDAFDLEMLELAQAIVQLRVQERTWKAFRLVAIEGFSGADAAAQTGMTADAVYVARDRVQKMLQEEIQKLEQPDK